MKGKSLKLTATSAGSTQAHGELVAAVLLAIGARPDVFAFRVNVCAGVMETGNYVRSVPKGTPDILAWAKPKPGADSRQGLGVGLALECKTGNAVLSKDQERWRYAFLARGGGIYREVRCVEDAVAAVEEARNA